MLKKITQLFICLLAIPFALQAQETNSSIGGIIKGATGEPLVGATIIATHNPTGTVYRSISRGGGRFDISNMTPGGPYTIVISFVGFTDEKKEDVFLSLGEKGSFNVALADKSGSLTEVVVASRRAANQARGGAETSIGRDKIANMPTVSRSLNDFIRLTPQAKITGDGGISIAGQNNRFNAFYIDGAINNDVFGLAASGTNGGQANVNPISIDAIDQFQVVLSPFDASIGGFTGGGINATTRSGTNEIHGSVWGFYRNEDLAGKTPGNVPKSARVKLDKLTNNVIGFRIGGPIVKNKLFFFLLGELERNTRPQPFRYADYRGTLTVDSINKLSNFLKTTYNYDPGGFLDNPETTDANRITAKLDWNISSTHKLSLSYRYNNGDRNNTAASNSTTINFFNNGILFPSKTNTYTAELRSSFKRGSTNRLLVTYSDVLDNRNPIGSPFPRVSIRDGAGNVVFGSENFSTGNYLAQKNITFNDAFKFNVGKNLITLGTDNLYSKANNVFIRDLFGTYQYSSLNDFIQNNKPLRYTRSFSLLENKTDEKNSPSAAKFDYLNAAFFINDEIKVSENFTINLGIRADKTVFLDDPLTDKFFNDTAIAAITAAGYDLKGARSGQISKVPWSISPRFGFTYKMPEENMTLRGGIGFFTGRMPLVWPGGVYNQNGVSIGGIDLNPPSASQNINFRADPFNQWSASDFGVSLANSKGQVDLMAKEFKLPRILRASMAVDKRLGNGWTFTTEAVISKNINETYYENVNILKPTLVSAGPGARTVYNSGAAPSRIPMRAGNINPYQGNIFLLYNNPDKKGFAYNFTATIDKAFKKGFSFNANYTYGSSIVTNENTSSQNNSQWRFMETVNGRNFVQRSTSDFDLGHRINAFVSKKFAYAKGKVATTVSLNYNGQQGQPFSYVYTRSIVNDNGRNETNDLIYVPTAQDLQNMVFLPNTVGSVTYSDAQQRQLLDDYINSDRYLNKRRGQFAERNGARLPFSHLIDLSLRQDFNLKMGKKTYTLQLSYDIYNFTNMLSRSWGQTYFLANDNFGLIALGANNNAAVFVSPTDLRPQYRFSPQTGKPWSLSTSTAPGLSARYLSQVGARIIF